MARRRAIDAIDALGTRIAVLPVKGLEVHFAMTLRHDAGPASSTISAP
ncbi:hypothetical protein [Rhodococcus qingshengii]|nr:hypothetical protein [Rhodococcus qingshengii]ULD38885.1 hypothetical protein JKI97_00865 [Rhodococcus qingshengii]